MHPPTRSHCIESAAKSLSISTAHSEQQRDPNRKVGVPNRRVEGPNRRVGRPIRRWDARSAWWDPAWRALRHEIADVDRVGLPYAVRSVLRLQMITPEIVIYLLQLNKFQLLNWFIDAFIWMLSVCMSGSPPAVYAPPTQINQSLSVTVTAS